MREPRWTRGAYAENPSVRRLEREGRWRGSAAIESWSGTPEELVHAARTLAHVLGAESDMKVTLSVADGRVLTPTSFEEFQRRLSEAPDEILAARVEATAGDERAVLVARRHFPGLIVEVEDTDRERAVGRTEAIFQRMMIGYVDRMRGVRGIAWMASAIAPLLLVGIAVAPGDTSIVLRAAVIAGALVAGLATLVVSYDRLLVSTPLDIRRQLPPPGMRRLGDSAKRIRDNRWTLRVLRVVGALLIGAAGSKLAEMLPFP